MWWPIFGRIVLGFALRDEVGYVACHKVRCSFRFFYDFVPGAVDSR